MSSSGVDKEKRGSSATVRACDSCRRRKRKCVYNSGAGVCSPCLTSKENCKTSHVRKPRAKSEKRANRIVEYEHRIKRLESLLEESSAAQPQLQEQPLPPADQSIPLSDWVSNLRNELYTLPFEEGPHIGEEGFNAGFEGFEGLGDEWTFDLESDLSFAKTSPENSISNLSGGSVPAPVLRDTYITHELPIQPTMQVTQPITHVQPPIVRAQCDGYLPPPELGTSLLSEFLVDFNTATPLYRPYTIAEHLRRCYIGGSDGTALAWASTYVVFGIAHRLRAMSATATARDNEQADYYMSRALYNIANLLLEGPSLGLIQCLLGLARLIQTSSLSAPHASFVSTALRMAQCLAYNDNQDSYGEEDQDIEQQRRVFWIAFLMETHESMMSNAPVSHRRDDIVLSLPEDNPHDAVGAVTAAEGTWRVNVFSLRTRLALLQADAIEKALSIRSRKRPTEEIYITTTYVLQGLQEWRKHELFQYNAEQLMQLLYRSDLVHVLILEASYFATVFRLQSFLILGMDSRVNPFSSEALVRLVNQKAHPCYKDAKKFLNLLSVAPQGDIGVSWMIKPSIVAALCTVLSNASHTSQTDVLSTEDMRSYSRIVQMLSNLAHKSQDDELQKKADICVMLFSKVGTARQVSDMQGRITIDTMPFQIEQVTFP